MHRHIPIEAFSPSCPLTNHHLTLRQPQTLGFDPLFWPLWRNWRQTDTSHLAEIRARPAPDGQPLVTTIPAPAAAAVRTPTDRVGLVLPTSMCSAQIARLAADRMNAKGMATALGLTRFVALTHSEGCGFGGESMYHTLYRTYRGYATHPNVAATLLLEHGCEKIPNDAMRRQFETAGLPLDRFGWASVQLDGGIDLTLTKIEKWFVKKLAHPSEPARASVGLGGLTIAVMTAAPLSNPALSAVLVVVQEILSGGGSVLLPESDALLADLRFTLALLGNTPLHATLANGQPFTIPGLHIVRTDSDHWVENLAGLGACGAHVFVGFVGTTPQQGHPLLPVLQVAEKSELPASAATDVDLLFTADAGDNTTALFRLLEGTVLGTYTPVATAGGFVDFQLSRGLLGVST